MKIGVIIVLTLSAINLFFSIEDENWDAVFGWGAALIAWFCFGLEEKIGEFEKKLRLEK